MIGGYDSKKMRDPSNLVWIDLPARIPYWQSSIGHVRVGQDEYRLSVEYPAIFDSGTSVIILPYCKLLKTVYHLFKAIADKVIRKVMQGKRFAQMSSNAKVVPCDVSKYEPLQLYIEGYWF